MKFVPCEGGFSEVFGESDELFFALQRNWRGRGREGWISDISSLKRAKFCSFKALKIAAVGRIFFSMFQLRRVSIFGD